MHYNRYETVELWKYIFTIATVNQYLTSMLEAPNVIEYHYIYTMFFQ